MQDQDKFQPRESLIKLNPTTITIPPPSKASPGLKLALTPHLTIQDPTLPTRREGIKKDGDAAFEVIIPVGGVIGVCVDISRDGLDRIGGADMSLTEEIELEGVVKKKVLGTFVDNQGPLALQEVRPGSTDSSFTLRPLSANAARSASVTEIIPSYRPIAYLTKLEISLNWYHPTRKAEVEESEENEDSPDSLPPEADVAGATRDAEEGITITAVDLPVWAARQLSSALDQLLRSNLIKRFPLIFDSEFPKYIPSITDSSNLINSITRVLALSASHRTELWWTARHSLEALVEQRNQIARYKQEQVSNLTRRTKARKRIKGDSASSSSQDTDSPPTVNDRAFPVDAGIRPLETARLSGAEKSDISSYLLRDAITQIGWDHWRKKRSTGGKMAYWRIQLCTNTNTSDPSTGHGNAHLPPLTSAGQLNDRMRKLHIDEERWDDFFEDHEDDRIDQEDGNGTHVQYTDGPLEEAYHDPFLFSDEDDLFASDDGNDEFFDDDEDDDLDDLLDTRMWNYQHPSSDVPYVPPAVLLEHHTGIPGEWHQSTHAEEADGLDEFDEELLSGTHDHDPDDMLEPFVSDEVHKTEGELDGDEDMPDDEVWLQMEGDKEDNLTPHHHSLLDPNTHISDPHHSSLPIVHDPHSTAAMIIENDLFDIDLDLHQGLEFEEEEGIYSQDDLFDFDEENGDGDDGGYDQMSLTPPSTPLLGAGGVPAPLAIFQNGWFGDDWFEPDGVEVGDGFLGDGGFGMDNKGEEVNCFDDEFMSDDEEEEMDGGMSGTSTHGQDLMKIQCQYSRTDVGVGTDSDIKMSSEGMDDGPGTLPDQDQMSLDPSIHSSRSPILVNPHLDVLLPPYEPVDQHRSANMHANKHGDDAQYTDSNGYEQGVYSEDEDDLF